MSTYPSLHPSVSTSHTLTEKYNIHQQYIEQSKQQVLHTELVYHNKNKDNHVHNNKLPAKLVVPSSNANSKQSDPLPSQQQATKIKYNVINEQLLQKIIRQSLNKHTVAQNNTTTHADQHTRNTQSDQLNNNINIYDTQQLRQHGFHSLNLSYQKILHIDNLSIFASNLQKLQLNNNYITDITNLNQLIQLQYLDLSFNHITAVDGLDSLVNLIDLNLNNNKIISIQHGISNLSKLQILSVSYNSLTNINELKYLRKFNDLRSLCIKNNHFANYTDTTSLNELYMLIYAYLPQLKYLNYSHIDPQQRERARDMYLDQLVVIENNEAEDRLQLQKLHVTTELKNRYQQCNVILLYDLCNQLSGTQSLQLLLIQFGAHTMTLNKLITNYKSDLEHIMNESIQLIFVIKSNQSNETQQYNTIHAHVVDSCYVQSKLCVESVLCAIRDNTLQYNASEQFDQLMSIELHTKQQIELLIHEYCIKYRSTAEHHSIQLQSMFDQLNALNITLVQSLNEYITNLDLAEVGFTGDDRRDHLLHIVRQVNHELIDTTTYVHNAIKQLELDEIHQVQQTQRDHELERNRNNLHEIYNLEQKWNQFVNKY